MIKYFRNVGTFYICLCRYISQRLLNSKKGGVKMLENGMKVTLPGISVQCKDGTIAHYRNSEYIPFFYMIPKEMIEYFGKPFVDIPREPYALFNYKDIKEKSKATCFS